MESADIVSADIVLRLDQVGLARGRNQVLAGVSFTVRRGELVALMGSSGSGKTTILRTVVGLERFQSGRVVVGDVALEGGVAATHAAVRSLRTKVGMVFQFHGLFEHLSALDNVCLAPVHVQQLARQDAERRARELFSAFGIEQREHALPRELSGGEAQRVAIARALAVDPQLLLMDEPTASLDAERRADLMDLLNSLVRRGRTLLVATHDENVARAATRTIRIHGGKCVPE
jgi:ABC-type polar amino acid transport system ATPase subunit